MIGELDRKVILLVEDNIDDERITLRALKRNNVMNEVVVACNGQEAIDFLFAQGVHAGRAEADMPCLIVLDLHMPGVSGLDVLREIRSHKRTEHIPVVMFSSSEDAHSICQSYDLGVNSFIKKPNDLAEFSETVLQLSMYWLLLNRTPVSAARV